MYYTHLLKYDSFWSSWVVFYYNKVSLACYMNTCSCSISKYNCNYTHIKVMSISYSNHTGDCPTDRAWFNNGIVFCKFSSDLVDT